MELSAVSRQLSAELAIAVKAARAAGTITEEYFGKAIESRDKALDHPVTDADIRANDAIKQIIRKAFPDDGWLSEECADSAERLGKDRVWIIDPIDGTKEFIAGVPEYVISIGLAINGTPELGVIFQPTTDRLYTSANLKSQISDLESRPPRIFVSRTEERKGLWQKYPQFNRIPCGSIAWKIVRTAIGEADGAITLNPRSEWDIAGAHAILRAAGGSVVDHDGTEVRYNREVPRTSMGVIAGSPAFIDRALHILKA